MEYGGRVVKRGGEEWVDWEDNMQMSLLAKGMNGDSSNMCVYVCVCARVYITGSGINVTGLKS